MALTSSAQAHLEHEPIIGEMKLKALNLPIIPEVLVEDAKILKLINGIEKLLEFSLLVRTRHGEVEDPL